MLKRKMQYGYIHLSIHSFIFCTPASSWTLSLGELKPIHAAFREKACFNLGRLPIYYSADRSKYDKQPCTLSHDCSRKRDQLKVFVFGPLKEARKSTFSVAARHLPFCSAGLLAFLITVQFGMLVCVCVLFCNPVVSKKKNSDLGSYECLHDVKCTSQLLNWIWW